MIKAIETEYNGYRFRSRLEARWAVFFDAMGVEYEYEKEGFEFEKGERYLPDFWLPNPRGWRGGSWVEIKGQTPTDREKHLAELLAKGTNKWVYIFSGEPYPQKFTVHYFPYHADDHADDFVSPNWIVTNGEFHGLGLTLRNQAFVLARSARFEYGQTPVVK